MKSAMIMNADFPYFYLVYLADNFLSLNTRNDTKKTQIRFSNAQLLIFRSYAVVFSLSAFFFFLSFFSGFAILEDASII